MVTASHSAQSPAIDQVCQVSTVQCYYSF